jgi:integrase/recombinase XerD
VHTAARAVRAFSNFLAAEEFVSRSPMQRVKLPKVDRRKPEAFTPEQVRTLLAAAKSQRDRAILLCLSDTGCRASEFVAWTVGDVNVMTGTVRVVQAKNRRERTVYLGFQARQALLKHLANLPDRSPTAPVWIDQQTFKRLLPGGLGQLLKRIGRRAGILTCGSHKFRRTFATWCLRNGMNIYDLKTLMGHSGLEMLLHYLDNDAQVAHNQYGAVDSLLSKPVPPTRRTKR